MKNKTACFFEYMLLQLQSKMSFAYSHTQERRSTWKTEQFKRKNKARTRTIYGIRGVKDSGAKLIFDNPILCAQFLRGYTDVDILKNVQPEDIEDVSERFLWMWQENRDSDSVKKIRVADVPGIETIFLITLIEHQSKVDYDMSFRI